MPSFYEFFAGGGMVRAGLGDSWTCLFANDFDHKKGAVYADNWGDEALKVDDVKRVKSADLPSIPDLVWASFPCQDLSLAGGGAGLKGDRSGTFWPFWSLMKKLKHEGRTPPIIALENVCGTLTSHNGKDFSAICKALSDANYKVGSLVINASEFVPQSRPRLFVIAVRSDIAVPQNLVEDEAQSHWHTRQLRNAYEKLPLSVQRSWVWWNLCAVPKRNTRFADLIEDEPKSVTWHSKAETKKLLNMMSNVNREKVTEAQKSGSRMVGTIYKRTRRNEDGIKVQRAEIRFDDIAGCLRTPAGGSSRQLIMVVDGNDIKSRLISSRETARLMGLPDDYRLPERYNEAYHLTGDGVVVPVVRHLASNIFEPLLASYANQYKEAA